MSDRRIAVSATRYETPQGKRYDLDDAGALLKQTLRRTEPAEAVFKLFETWPDYCGWRRGLDARHMLHAGTYLPEDDGRRVVFKGHEADGTISASCDYLAMRDGPGVMVIDVDVKRPDEVPAVHGWEGAADLDAVLDMLEQHGSPAFDDVAVLAFDSSSSRLYRAADGVELTGAGGFHVEVAVENAADIPELLKRLHWRLVAAGFGWAFVTQAGRVELRSPVDLAMARPTQPHYGTPVLGEGIESRGETIDADGRLLRLEDVPPLTDAETDACHEFSEAAAAALRDTAEAVGRQHRSEARRNMTRRGLTDRQAQRVLEKIDGGVLPPDATVVFLADGAEQEVNIADLILGQGDELNGADCLDPIEPDYDGRRCVAKLYWDRVPCVHSFAHGSRVYRLESSPELFRQVLPELPKTIGAVSTQVALVPEEECAALIREAAAHVGLGNRTKPLTDAVKAKRAARPEPDEERNPAPVPERQRAKTFEDRYTGPFPDVGGDPPRPLRTEANVRVLLDFYGIELSYDQIRKSAVHEGPLVPPPTDNAEEVMAHGVQSLAHRAGLPDKDVSGLLTAIADDNQVNPVLDCLNALPAWDGEDRFPELAGEIAADPEVAADMLRIWFTQAVAAADGGETGCRVNPDARPAFEYCLVLVGAQGEGKTKGMRALFPAAVQHVIRDSLLLALNNKDSLLEAVRHWVVELGELDSTFRKSDIAAMKAFLSREHDELRVPYARRASAFARRTVFLGTVNEDQFLADQTGNRRYLAFRVRGLPVSWPADFIEQLWAQAWHAYRTAGVWWPSKAQEAVFAEHVGEQFEQENPWTERFRSMAWDEDSEDFVRLTAVGLYERFMGAGARDPSPADLKSIGHAMRAVWLENGAEMIDGVLKVNLGRGHVVRCNSQDGKKRGWLAPSSLAGRPSLKVVQ